MGGAGVDLIYPFLLLMQVARHSHYEVTTVLDKWEFILGLQKYCLPSCPQGTSEQCRCWTPSGFASTADPVRMAVNMEGQNKNKMAVE